jgi:hypothetical protein
MRAGLLAALSLLLPGTVWAGTFLPAPPTDPASGIRVSITSYFSEPPIAGMVPLQVRIENGSRREGRWELRFSSRQNWPQDQLESRHELQVEAGGDRTFEILVPQVPRPATVYMTRLLQLLVSGPGMGGRETTLFSRTYTPSTHAPPRSAARPPASAPYAGMSQALHAANWDPLEKDLAAAGNALIGSRFDPALLPSSWQAYSAFASFWMTDEEWRALAGGPRRAILEWVGLGGFLQIAAPASAPPGSDLPPIGQSSRRGFGQIAVVARDGARLADLAAAKAVLLDERPALHSQADHYDGWSLAGLVGQPSLPVKRIVLFLAGYGLVLTPLNLFLCHRSGRRDRLFWTTPLISLVVAGGLAALILFQDGTGGDGRRFTAVFVSPEDHQAFVVQEQVARTGALLSGSFASAEPLLVACLSLEPRAGGFPYAAAARGHARSYGVDALRYTGDWFTNRSVQGHLVETVRPTRARLEVEQRPGSSPEVRSTFGGTLDELFLVDANGSVWRGHAVVAGRPVALSESTLADFESWWMLGLAGAGARGRALLEPMSGLTGHFFARASGEGPIETSRAVRWQQEQLLLVGTATFGAALGS